jgi:hypothetical protein
MSNARYQREAQAALTAFLDSFDTKKRKARLKRNSLTSGTKLYYNCTRILVKRTTTKNDALNSFPRSGL